MEQVQQEADNLEHFCAKTMLEVDDKFAKAEQNCKNKQLAIETIFLMIK
jgi:hypothetical protein